MTQIVQRELAGWPTVKIGVHAHNDTDMAVANSLAAVKGGATLIQGCINGYGERTGNANLVSHICVSPFLAEKLFRESVVIDNENAHV